MNQKIFNSKVDNVFINEEANKYLENIVKSKLFANGYIFYGAEGVGKRTTAIKFIKEIFKQYSSIKNIEEKIINNNHPDFLVVEPTSLIKGKTNKSSASQIPNKNNSEIIKIDQIRNLQTFISHKSLESEKKVVLILDAHLLNESASNCLLKTLEEPYNGIIILLTSKLNLLLDTIKSRCQLVRFKSFPSKQIEVFLKNNLDPSQLEINKKINFHDLVNSANGSPCNILDNIKIWNSLSDEIKNKLDSPLEDNLEILKVSKLISEQLDLHQQINLINFIQQIWWRKTRNQNIAEHLEILKSHIKNKIQPRLSWEVILLKIAIED